ncbi:unnamed protein product [Medioppia subpectinata]|uniref:BED-type domain-containing protein n=1 Tax=Medioppia subpectinata TaxID=1979941 RepID=A0A7R9PV42_9ACAR|nr:unnamed protein product [Medioppia subpectinata]CAG2102426.1 unnamed protein product [Medioppia subpectinata]
MDECDCDELMASIGHKVRQLVADGSGRTALLDDLTLIHNTYKAIIEWKVREICKLRHRLRQLSADQHIPYDDHSAQDVAIDDKNANNGVILANHLIPNNGQVDQMDGHNDNRVNNCTNSMHSRCTNAVQCVQILAVDNTDIDCPIDPNSGGMDSEDIETNSDDNNSVSDAFADNGYPKCCDTAECVEFEAKAGQRHSRSLVWKYFKYDSDTNITHCLVKECTSKGIKGKLAGNLKRHLRKHHKQFQQFTKAVNRLEMNITINKKVLNKCSMDSRTTSVGNEGNGERSFDLFEINDYFITNPKDDPMPSDTVYPNRRTTGGRKCESSVWRFFAYDSTENIAYCLVTNCKSKGIRGKLAGNLRKHLLTHKREFDELMARDAGYEQNETIEHKCNLISSKQYIYINS